MNHCVPILVCTNLAITYNDFILWHKLFVIERIDFCLPLYKINRHKMCNLIEVQLYILKLHAIYLVCICWILTSLYNNFTMA